MLRELNVDDLSAFEAPKLDDPDIRVSIYMALLADQFMVGDGRAG